MNMDITYEQAMADHPTEAAEATALLRKSRSKHRKADPATLKWLYVWGVEVRGNTFEELLDGTALAQSAKRRARTLKERIADEASRTRVSIAVAGYGSGLPSVPVAIMRGIIEGQTENLRQEQRADALSAEERATEVERLLGELRGPGFAAVRLEP